MLKKITQEKNIFLLIFVLIIIVSFLGTRLDLMAPDGVLYATISKTVYQTNDFINLYSHGYDWLDKPHLPFWIAAISFKIFGVSDFAYRLPAILIFFFGALMTYKFTKENYNQKTALLATLILLTATHSVISNFDVRAEPYLTAFIISSVYYLDRFLKKRKKSSFFLFCFFSSLAIMTKGIFALIPIIAALAGELIVKRKWKEMISPVWIIALLIILIFITPELYALYLQFDLHPEKVIFGHKNVSGIKFFFWDSQFGRFFNTGPIKGSGDKFFFFHTILWAFLPWGVLYYLGSFLKIKRNFKLIIKSEEFYSLFGSLATILIFSLSKFQLPHYTNIIFPFMAIIVADFIYKLATNYRSLNKTYLIIHWVQNLIVISIIIGLVFMLKPTFNYSFLIVFLISFYIIWLTYLSKKERHIKTFIYSSVCFLVAYGFLFTHFYPVILKYQSGIIAAKYINKNYKGKGTLIKDKTRNLGFEFYLKNSLERVDSLNLDKAKNKIFYLSEKQYNYFIKKKVNFKTLKELENFHVSKLNIDFLNPSTREKVLKKSYVVQVK